MAKAVKPTSDEVKIGREDFLAALERVKPALQSAGSIPQLKHIWFDENYIYAYNGAMGIRLTRKCGLKPCGVPGAVLMGLLQSSSAKEIVIQEGEAKWELKMGRSHTTIPIMPPKSNPWSFPATPPDALATLDLSKELCAGLTKAKIIRASNPKFTRHYGIMLFPDREDLVLYTTDDRSLAEIPVKMKAPKELAKMLLPYGFVSQLLAMGEGKITFAADAIIAEFEGVQVCSNVLDSSTITDIPKLVSDTINGSDAKMVDLPEGFSEALDRAMVLAGDLDKSYLTLKLSKKEVELSGKLEHGLLNEKFPITGGSDGEINLGLAPLKMLVKESEAFAISSNRALILGGEGEELYLVASFVTAADVAAVAKEKATADG